MANGKTPPGAGGGTPGGSSVQCGRNGSDVWRARALDAQAELARARRPELVPFAAAFDAAARWSRDWLDVYGQPTALWELLLRFAALIAQRPGEKRQLDERHTFALFEAEPGGIVCLDAGGVALVLPFGTVAHGRPLPDGEVAELEALARGAIQRVEALGAEADLFRHAGVLIRGDGFSERWTAGCDCRDVAGVPCEPHPDAYRWSLVGALRQAWAERGGLGPVPLASLRRLVSLALPRVEPPTVDLCLDVLRVWNDQDGQTAKGVLEVLTRAALYSEAEAEGEVF
ncbi:MAG: hypothetical protein HYZ29_23235 [Myxococcales bacterium]|nr:hypothetical protein [Myxococcales bacterium]